jgi:hypothetical protein
MSMLRSALEELLTEDEAGLDDEGLEEEFAELEGPWTSSTPSVFGCWHRSNGEASMPGTGTCRSPPG